MTVTVCDSYWLIDIKVGCYLEATIVHTVVALDGLVGDRQLVVPASGFPISAQ